MRNLIFLAVLASSVCSLSFWEKAQGYLSGNEAANASAGASGSAATSNFWAEIQNSSFGQSVQGGINLYNQAKNNSGSNNWQTALANSSLGNYYQQGVNFFSGNGSTSFIDTAAIQQSIGNSSFGEAVQSGIDFYNNLKNGPTPWSGSASDVIGSFVPFLANASTEAKTEFYAILPKVGNMTINEFETAVDEWAAKYGLTQEVEAFNQRKENETAAAEAHANDVVMNLPNVINNLKAIRADKNQTAMEMHSRMMTYINSLDDDTQEIVFVFFKSFLPPQFTKPRCVDNGNFLTNMYQKASEFFGGNNSTMGSGNGNGNGMMGGNGNMFGSIGSLFSSFNKNGNGNGTDKPHPMLGMLSNFMNKNNISENQANAVMNGVQHDEGFASIQILPVAQADIGRPILSGEGDFSLQIVEQAEATTKKNKKQQQQVNKNKNKKKTTVAPIADANVALEVNAQVL
ncbi:hypothetical protein L5515_011477 [Caenorhabditis briggsae]|uniref:SXP/RAL-2 family protein Ani s 5-like cation-binding domain-containing protein n=1 Tax=Caenorhabditis briggsae TaxID=6238 RepID=A0AAE9JGG4_CAEBR|nr:hypothetical protein L5515_011477 [Caenorhabditis briggsae]